MLKWERLQLNPFLYSHDQFHYRDKLAEAFEEERKELMATCPLVGSDPQQERVEQLHQKNVKEALEVCVCVDTCGHTYLCVCVRV